LNDWFQSHFKTFDARLHKLANLMSDAQVNRPVDVIKTQ
jgi:hypothetical protein